MTFNNLRTVRTVRSARTLRRLSALLIPAAALTLALSPMVAAAASVEVEVAGVQAGPDGSAQFVCAYTSAGGEQSCSFPLVASATAQGTGSEVAGVQAAGPVTIQVAGVVALPGGGSQFVCSFNPIGGEQTCLLG